MCQMSNNFPNVTHCTHDIESVKLYLSHFICHIACQNAFVPSRLSHGVRPTAFGPRCLAHGGLSMVSNLRQVSLEEIALCSRCRNSKAPFYIGKKMAIWPNLSGNKYPERKYLKVLRNIIFRFSSFPPSKSV